MAPAGGEWGWRLHAQRNSRPPQAPSTPTQDPNSRPETAESLFKFEGSPGLTEERKLGVINGVGAREPKTLVNDLSHLETSKLPEMPRVGRGGLLLQLPPSAAEAATSRYVCGNCGHRLETSGSVHKSHRHPNLAQHS